FSIKNTKGLSFVRVGSTSSPPFKARSANRQTRVRQANLVSRPHVNFELKIDPTGSGPHFPNKKQRRVLLLLVYLEKGTNEAEEE
ncbi:hypothetical protein ACH5RR_017056, partial [Cinchona calisaya]